MLRATLKSRLSLVSEGNLFPRATRFDAASTSSSSTTASSSLSPLEFTATTVPSLVPVVARCRFPDRAPFLAFEAALPYVLRNLAVLLFFPAPLPSRRGTESEGRCGGEVPTSVSHRGERGIERFRPRYSYVRLRACISRIGRRILFDESQFTSVRHFAAEFRNFQETRLFLYIRNQCVY